MLDGSQLQAASTAVTVHANGGQAQVTEGPAVDAGAEVNGYYIYDAADLGAAIAFAARIPVVRMGGTVEVRALREGRLLDRLVHDVAIMDGCRVSRRPSVAAPAGTGS